MRNNRMGKGFILIMAILLTVHTFFGGFIASTYAAEATPASSGQSSDGAQAQSDNAPVQNESTSSDSAASADSGQPSVTNADAESNANPVPSPSSSDEVPASEDTQPAQEQADESTEVQTQEESASPDEATETVDSEADLEAAEKADAEETEQAAQAPVPVSENILNAVTLTDDAGQPIVSDDPDRFFNGENAISLNYAWALENGHPYTAGSVFEFDVPSQFRIYTPISDAPLIVSGEDGSGESAGSFSVTTDGHVTVTFSEFIESHSDVAGTLTIRTELTREVVQDSTQVKLTFPITSGEQAFVLYLKPEAGLTLSKKGTADNAAGVIRWSVDLNTSEQTLRGVKLKDAIPDGLALEAESITVTKLTKAADGMFEKGEAADPASYTLNTASGELELDFGSGELTGAYRVDYSTKLQAGKATSFKNTAVLSAQSRQDASASATVTVQRGLQMDKKVAAYDDKNQTIDWEIRYNYGDAILIPADQALLEDRFTSGQSLIENTFQVYKGSELLVRDRDYTLKIVPESGGLRGFNLQFLQDVNAEHNIKYSTKAAIAVYAKDRITNTVTSGGIKASASQVLERNLFVKTNKGADFKKRVTSWQIAINTDRFDMRDVMMKDTFPEGGLEFQESTLVIKRENGSALVRDVDYTLTTDNGIRSGFEIKFTNAVTQRYVITYDTRYEVDWKKNQKEKSFLNSSQLDFTHEGKPRVKTSSARFWPDDLTVANGAKSGVYDPSTKEITWTIKANYNQKRVDDAAIVDRLTQGQRYVEGSLEVNDMNLTGTWLGARKGASVDPSRYSASYPDADNGNELKIAFPNGIESAYWITFKTTLKGSVIEGTNVTNQAVLTGNGQTVNTWDASVNIPGGGTYAAKEGVQQADRILWTIKLNQGQSYVENARIVDTHSGSQFLDDQTFRLYRLVSSSDGKSTRGEELKRDVDYTLDIMSGDSEQFELKFAKPIESAYELEYQTVIRANDREKLSNSVRFEGDGVKKGTVDSTREIIVRTTSGSGTGGGVTGALEVTKTDAADAAIKLPGAVFVLQDSAGRRAPITRTTDEKGQIVFGNLLYGSYTLTETKAPEGYKLGDEGPATIVIGTKTLAENNGRVKTTVENEKLPNVPTTPPTEPGTPTTPPTEPGTPTTPPTEPGTPTTPPTEPGTLTPPPTEPPVVQVPDENIPQGPTEPPTQPVTPTVPPTDNTPQQPQPTEPGIEVPDENTPQGPPEVPAQPVSPEQPATPSENPEVPVPVDPIPQGVPPVVPGEPEFYVPDGDVPQGTPPVVPGTVVPGTVVPNNEADVPQDVPMLPQTGEESKLPYLFAGIGLILFGLVLRRRASMKNR
ncbi:LPXTG cell wall anchor domain-containing protein [Saccharibacillus endophyticus]